MELTKEQQQAYKWAINQSFPSVAATYAKILAGVITQLEAENGQLRTALEQYADKNNWAHYDKGDGNYVDACFLGSGPAEEALGGE